ncbi:protein kinase superfamily protein [Striga asiatica]|uniref:Protein kinase superfamily protein n=1 Tax=Striga asiatica TaxID=4170 RepID=A0A5A7QDV8_STRAF|nr:protein kinase superfamily protein [Striga asiatica]
MRALLHQNYDAQRQPETGQQWQKNEKTKLELRASMATGFPSSGAQLSEKGVLALSISHAQKPQFQAEVSLSGSIQKKREILGNLVGCPDIIRCFDEETTVGANGAIVYNLLLEYGAAGTLAGRIRESNGGRGRL